MDVAPSKKRLAPGLEREVLQLLLEGLSSKEIGLRLGRSRATIEIYVRILRGKYDARSRLQLVARAVRNDLVARNDAPPTQPSEVESSESTQIREVL